MSWDVTLRAVNVVGCLVALYLLARAALQQWPTWNFKTQQHWWALFGWVALCVEGSIESVILDAPPGPRTVITTLVIAWTLRALLIREKLEAGPVLNQKGNS